MVYVEPGAYVSRDKLGDELGDKLETGGAGDGDNEQDYRLTDTDLGNQQRKKHSRVGRSKVGKPRGTSGTKHKIRYMFGQRLMQLRTKRGITQEEAARTLDVTKQTWSELERGLISTTLDRLQEVATQFEVPISYFIDDVIVDEVPDMELFDRVRLAWTSLSPEHQQMVYDIISLFKSKSALTETSPPEIDTPSPTLE